PIGRVGPLQPGRSPNFDAWVETLKEHPEATDAVLDAFYNNLYAPGFAYSVNREFVKSCQTPCLVLAGNDAAHPFAIAEEIAQLLPHAEFIPEWKEGDPLAAATTRMKQFLSDHTPVRA
ncbi:MAG TPA: alpha/beta hydrolase, partial [Dehalococcoidia bacterium]|nr:alpha/beta hydrolase [Dehalococcoidia bacterium]